MNELQQNIPSGDIVIAMCATKCDLAMNQDTSQAEALAARTGSMFITTSAKTNTNVNLLFQKVTECVLENQRRSEGLPATLGTLDTTTPSASNERPISPSTMNGFSNGSSFHGGSRIPTTPLSTLQECNKDKARRPVDGKR